MKYSRLLWPIAWFILPLSFGLTLTLTALSNQRVLFQFDWDGTRRSLYEGLVGVLLFGIPVEFVLSLILSGLTWVVLRRPFRFWRPFTFCMSALASVPLLVLLWQCWKWYGDDDGFPIPVTPYPVDITVVLFFGLPLLWTLSLMFFSITTRSDSRPMLETH